MASSLFHKDKNLCKGLVDNEVRHTLFLNLKEWLTTDEAADYLGLSVGSLRNLTSNGHVTHYKLGRRNRYRLEDLRNLLLSQKRGGFHGNRTK